MEDILLRIESKWGDFVSDGHALCNKNMPFVSPKAFLNLLFTPEMGAIREFFNSLKADILPGLEAFYEQYNGCRLFFSSLNIFGIRCHSEDLYTPFDLRIENYNMQAVLKGDGYIFFGALGGNYTFAYKRDERSKIYAFQKEKKKILREFDSFDSWFSYYFNTLYEEYDADGRKNHPNKRYREIPALFHETIKFF